MKRALLLFSFCSLAMSGIKLTDVQYKKLSDKSGHVIINYTGQLEGAPELEVRERMLQVSIPDSIVWPQIKKRINLKAGTKQNNSLLSAYQFTKDIVRVRMEMPFNISKHARNVRLKVSDKSIQMFFPIRGRAIAKKFITPAKRADSVKLKKKTTKTELENYDEKYLDYLLSQNDEKPEFKSTSSKSKQEEAALDKTEEETFPYKKYISRYLGFLAIFLVLFYAVLTFFRKGALKRGNLSFLKNPKSITVLNTTYIAPKKSLMVVKVYDKILLLGNSDSGISFISELDNMSDVIKDSEKSLSGDNFDSVAGAINDTSIEDKVHLKQNPFEGSKELEDKKLDKFLSDGPQEKVKFSDQVKKKLKGLKQLQQ